VPCDVICISHAMGAGGSRVGELVAEALDFRSVDEEIVARAAAIGGIHPEDIASEEQRRGLVDRILRELGRGIAVDQYGVVRGDTGQGATPDGIRALIMEAITQTAAEGRVVMVAHAASRALSGRAGVLRVLVTAPAATRAKRLAEADGLDPSAAEKAIKESDAARADYLRRFYDVSSEAPTDYDLVVNTDDLSVEQAADLIVLAAR
jgi:Cytidylate kinase-like family